MGDETLSSTSRFSLCQSVAFGATTSAFIWVLSIALLGMSESAAIVKFFFSQALSKFALPSTLQTDGAEDRALPGGNLSADSGAKTRPGFGVQLNPGNKMINWDWH